MKVCPCNVSEFFKLAEECTVGKKIIIDFEQVKYFLLKEMNLLSNIEKIKSGGQCHTDVGAPENRIKILKEYVLTPRGKDINPGTWTRGHHPPKPL